MLATFRSGATTAVLSIAALTASAQAQAPAPAAPSVRSEKNISLALANEIAAASVAACAANGYAVSATVVDRAGVVRAVQRSDNAGPHTLGASERKAWTSASATGGRHSAHFWQARSSVSCTRSSAWAASPTSARA